MTSVRKQKTLKQVNRKVILNILRNSGELLITELSKKVDLSKPTLMKIMNYYIGEGLVVIVGKGNSTDVSLTISSGSFNPGSQYEIKLITAKGTTIVYPATYNPIA